MRPPEKITPNHLLEEFDCRNEVLNDWLKRKAMKNEIAHHSRTYVISDNQKVIGCYSIATGGVEHAEVPSSLKHNAPNPIPVMILGRLAIDIQWQGKGLGKALLQHAIFKTVEISELTGVKALIVHAISPEAKAFYLANDFITSPIDMTLMLPVKDILKNI